MQNVTLGVKDIIDVAGLPTKAGSQGMGNHPAAEDAECVRLLRAAGLKIVGKTTTTAYASFDPSPALNPWNIQHTPGGSSSGSAVAVSLGQVQVALGTQTGGSVIRPAAYCGVYGFKPTWGAISLKGVLPLAPSLDHLGWMAKRIQDLQLLWKILAGQGTSNRHLPLSLLNLGGYFSKNLDHQIKSMMQHCCDLLSVDQLEETPSSWNDIDEVHLNIMAIEASQVHAYRFHDQPEDYPPNITRLIRHGQKFSQREYQQLLDSQKKLRDEAIDLWRNRILITPAIPSPAPESSTTGDPRFNTPWSLLGWPTVCMPVRLSDGGLPMAIQLSSPPGTDQQLLETAAGLERDFPWDLHPPVSNWGLSAEQFGAFVNQPN
ncbi:MAG: amidase [Zavarzinella sp.]